MDENPYVAPQSEPSTETGANRLTGGTLVFAGLGLVLLLLGIGVIVSVNQGPNIPFRARLGVTVGAFLLAALGLSQIIHGVIRTALTARWMVLAMMIFLAFVVAVSLLGLL